MTKAPNRVRVRMYTVGFGDCFLVTFGYPAPVDGRDERHMLVDFGTKDLAPGGPSTRQVADFVARDCGGKLDVVVVSHRHQDHLSGFGSAAAGKVVAALHADAVIRSWTEDPALPAEATSPDLPASPGADPSLPFQAAHARSLDAGQELADAIAGLKLPERASKARAALRRLAAYEGKNKAAVERLGQMSDGDRGRYVSFGSALDLEDILPGVSVDVIGPPLPTEWEPIRRQRADDPEFWLRLAKLIPAGLGTDALTLRRLETPASDGGSSAAWEGEGEPVPPGPAHWVIDRVERGRLSSALRIVRWLDRALNNTSVVLLVEAAGRRMLLPGDAQIENWSYVLTGRPPEEGWLARLAKVDLYKVAHHGSRNATPKLSLFPLWGQVREDGSGLLSMMSTLSGTFDEEHPVPSTALIEALGTTPLRLVSSQPPEGAATRPYVDAVAGPGSGPFRIETG